MAAPRKYSNAQRAAMFAFYEQGYTPAEIARRCKLGTASVDAFEIPRRTVQEIVTQMERERGGRLPKTLDDAASDLAAAFPKRILRTLNREVDRFDAKTRNGRPLSLEDLDRLKKISGICRELRTQAAVKKARESASPGVSGLAELARQMNGKPVDERSRGGNSPSPNLPDETPNYVIHDFVPGKKRRNGKPLPPGEMLGDTR